MVTVNVNVVKQFSEEDNRVEVFAIVTTDDEEYLRKMMRYHGKNNIVGKQYIHMFLYRLFRNHAEFYQTIGFEYNYSRHHGGDSDFESGCGGFEEFMSEYYGATKWREVNEESLQEIANVAMVKIKQLIQQYEQARNTHVSVSTSTIFTNVQTRTETTTLDKIDFRTNDVLLLTGNKVYKVTLNEAEDVKSLNDIANSIANSVHSSYELQLKSRITVLENRIQELEQELEQAKQRYLKEGVKLALSELNGWKIEGDYAVYNEKIYVTAVKKDGRIYHLPESFAHRFYVEGLKLKIEENITKAYCDRSYHANVNGDDVCIGSLSGQDFITVAKKLPETLKVMNLDSTYGNEAMEEAEELIRLGLDEVVTWTI